MIQFLLAVIIMIVSGLILFHAFFKVFVYPRDFEIAKLERLRGNDACEIDFMKWNIARIRRSEGRAVEAYQKLTNRKMYCLVRGRSDKMNVSIGYMVGYRCEALPLGFIIDFKGGTMTDKATGEVFPLSNR